MVFYSPKEDPTMARRRGQTDEQIPAAFAADWATTMQTTHTSQELLETLA